MVVEGALTHPCPSFAVGKPTMVVVQVQGAPHVVHTWDCAISVTQDQMHQGN